MSRPLKGFITYAHKNTAAKDELITRLSVMQQQNKLVTWHDAEMTGGTKWREDIFKHLTDSDILLYLVSAASLASENCNKELAEAVSSDIRIIPIILEDCNWQYHQLSDFQAFPDKCKPINEWKPESRGWQNVAAGIRKTVHNMQTQVDSSSKAFEKELRAELAFQQGNVFIMLGAINKAIKAYSRAIEFYPNNANTYHNRGVAYFSKSEYDRAIADYTKAIELNPDYAIAYNNRGGAYYLKEEYDSAIIDFTKAIELNPDYAIAYNNRGRTYGVKDEVDGLTLRPDSPTSKRAVIRAIKDYNPAIGLNPELAPAYYNRGVAWLRLREWERAKSDLTVATDKGINIITAFRNDYESVESFEQRHGVQLPEDIAAMLL